MAGLKLAAFAGMAPRVSKTLLKDNEAQRAVNTDLSSGELQSWRKPGRLNPRVFVPPATKSIFRYRDTDGDDLWLNWTTDVDVARGPIFGNEDEPIYYTGDGLPKKTNRTLATADAFLALGVPNPTVAPTGTPSGGSGASQSRFYLYTYVSEFGDIVEESGPSPVSALVTVLAGGSVTVGDLPAAAPPGDYNITKVRIYRQVTGTASNAYLQVGEVTIGTTSFVDNTPAEQLGPAISTTNFEPPPDDLKGIVNGANGILAGFRGNEVFFSETFQPHAWPSEYALAVEFPIVGLKALGESFVVMTTGNPFIASGSSPRAMTLQKLPIYEPCIAKRSIVADEAGVMYASPNGVVRIAQGFAGVVTKSLFSRDDWQAYQPVTMVGAVRSGEYYYLFSSSINFLGSRGGLILDRDDQASAFTVTTLHTEAVFTEPTSADLFIVEGGEIKSWEGDLNNFLPYEWKSKLFILPRPANMGAVQVEAEFGDIQIGEALQEAIDELIAQNQIDFVTITEFESTVNAHEVNGMLLGGSVLAPLPVGNVDGRYVTLRAYCDGRMVAALNIRSRQMYRLPSGFKGDRWEFMLTGNVPLRHLKVAETAKELVAL